MTWSHGGRATAGHNPLPVITDVKNKVSNMASSQSNIQLSKEELRALGDVRRSVWKGGFYGLGVGTFTSWAVYEMAYFARRRRGYFKFWQFSPSTRMFSVLAGGALGSFLMSCRAGKKDVKLLHPVFQNRSNPRLTSYQQQVLEAKKQDANVPNASTELP